MKFKFLADTMESNGKTIRQNNAAKTHSFPVGSLIEISNGCRLYVFQWTRDCDQTPLYVLSVDDSDGFVSSNDLAYGYAEKGMKLIKKPK